ncbi:MAG: FtsX-like permease family protein [Acidobacteria bacterium]|nr:FtsX-like permease family protein [Acidobacteriota bacterium]
MARWLESLLQDLRYGARQLALNPAFTVVATLSLALGIGANSAMFQLINALRFRGLPVEEPARLAAVEWGPNFHGMGSFGGRNSRFTFAQLRQIQLRQKAFTGVMAFGTTRFNLSPSGEARYAEGLYVTPNFLDVLGVQPTLGAWLDPRTNAEDCSQAGALVNYQFWLRELGGDVNAVGGEIAIDGRTFPVAAVTPPSFFGVEPARRFDIALPVCAQALFAEDGRGRLADKTFWWLTPIGRLRPDWSAERASAHLRDISPAILRESLPESYRPDSAERYLANRLRAESAPAGVSSVRSQYENPLWILLASTGLVLAIACANLANLLLARACSREREIAVRTALGASRARLVSQLIAESAPLALLGAGLGAGIAGALSRAMVAFLQAGEAGLEIQLGVDWRVFAFTAGLAVATCLLFGLAPALRATRAAPADAMRGGRTSTAGSDQSGPRRALAAAQIALSLILLVGALLFGRSLQNLLATDPGLDAEGVLVAAVDARSSVAAPERRLIALEQLGDRLTARPEVESAAFALFTPFSGSGWNEHVHAADDPDPGEGVNVWFNGVGPGYFEAMRTPLLAGRDFQQRDDRGSPSVAIVNQRFAERLFGSDNPIGRSFRYPGALGETDPVFEIVGLVKDSKYSGLREERRAIAYVPVAQLEGVQNELSFVVRARGPLQGAMEGFRSELAQVDVGLKVEFSVLAVQVERSVMTERLMAGLSSGFGILAALLSTLGLYGVMAYMVARRRKEIGVRMALGAQGSAIRALVLGEVGRLTAIGLAIGLAGSVALSRYAESLLFGIGPNDVSTLAAGCVLLAVTAFGAAWIPVCRAVAVDPSEVLRDD